MAKPILSSSLFTFLHVYSMKQTVQVSVLLKSLSEEVSLFVFTFLVDEFVCVI